jgi:hypothetical protein
MYVVCTGICFVEILLIRSLWFFTLKLVLKGVDENTVIISSIGL